MTYNLTTALNTNESIIQLADTVVRQAGKQRKRTHRGEFAKEMNKKEEEIVGRRKQKKEP